MEGIQAGCSWRSLNRPGILHLRFDYFTTGESIKYEKKVAVPKFLLFIAAALALLLL